MHACANALTCNCEPAAGSAAPPAASAASALMYPAAEPLPSPLSARPLAPEGRSGRMWVFSRSARYRLHSSADRVEPCVGHSSQGAEHAVLRTHAAHATVRKLSRRQGAQLQSRTRRCDAVQHSGNGAHGGSHLRDARALVVPAAAQLEQVGAQVLAQQPDDAVPCHALVHHLPPMPCSHPSHSQHPAAQFRHLDADDSWRTFRQ